MEDCKYSIDWFKGEYIQHVANIIIDDESDHATIYLLSTLRARSYPVFR